MALDKLTKVQSVGISSFIQVVGVVTALNGLHVTSGNVAIGHNNPLNTLHVKGPTGGVSARFTDAVNATVFVSHPSSGKSKIADAGGNYGFEFDTASVNILSGGSERLRITSDGYARLTTANARLEWIASSGSNPFIRSIGSGQQELEFNTGGSERLRITSSGVTVTGSTTVTEGLVLDGQNGSGKGLRLDLAGSSDYVIQETTTNDIVQFGGTGSSNFFTHNISSGSVGIATAVPSYRLDIGNGANDPAGGYQLRVNAAGDYIFALQRQSAPSFSIRNNSTGIVHLNTQNSKILSLGVSSGNASGSIEDDVRIDSNGHLTILDGNLVVASGHGIDFSATSDTSASNASASSELLDDYEEGNWTPRIINNNGSSANISAQPSNRVGTYVKIGNRLFFNCWITGSLTTTETTISLRIAGLPYNSSSDGSAYSALTIWNYSAFSGYRDEIIVRNNTGDDQIILQRYGGGLTFDDIVKSGINFMVSGQYRV